MNIAVIGAGHVGGTLGSRLAQAGHMIYFGVRNHEGQHLKDVLALSGRNGMALAVPEATAKASVVILATPWEATRGAVISAGKLAGKILIDCTNPIAPDLAGLTVGTTTSGAEQVAGWAKDARVVKAFNNTGYQNMIDPRYGSEAATMFYCGDDEDAKATVRKLILDVGFDPCDVGPLTASRYLEPMAMVWITLAHVRGLGTNIAFKLMKR